MSRHSQDSISLYSKASLYQQGSVISSLNASPSSAEVVLGTKSIDARRLSPLSTSYGSSGAWALPSDNNSDSVSKKRLSHSRSMGSNTDSSPRFDFKRASKTMKNDGELLGEMFSSVNSNLHVSFPTSFVEKAESKHDQEPLQRHHDEQQPAFSQLLIPSRPPRVNKFSFSRNLMPFQEEEGTASTPPRKLRADLQSKFSMSPDTRSATARSAKAVKKRASQSRVRKNSNIRDRSATLQIVTESVKPKLKPQSSLQGLRKLVGLTPNGRQSKPSTVSRYEDFPESLRVAMECQAMKDASSIENTAIQRKRSNGELAQGHPDTTLDHVLTRPESREVKLPEPPIHATSTDGFWRKIRASTKPRETNNDRSSSRCESRATKRTCEEVEEIGNGKGSRWWSRIKDNAVKMVGQPSMTSKPPTLHLQRPSITIDEDHDKFQGSLDAAMALSDGLRGCYSPDLGLPHSASQSMPDPMQQFSSKRKKRPPVPLLLLQSRKEEEEEEGSGRFKRPYTAAPTPLSSMSTLQAPYTAPVDTQTAKERGGSKKAWLRPLQLTAVLRNHPLPSSVPSQARINVKQSDPCLMQRTAAEVTSSPPRTRLSVPALSSIKYRDTLPIPPRSRKSRASTISSMDSRTSGGVAIDEHTQRTEYTQRTVGSSILFKDEDLMQAGYDHHHHHHHHPPRESLPGLPFSSHHRERASSVDSGRMEDGVTPREATDILYNLVRGFKNDNSPSTFRTISAVTQTIASKSHLTPLQPTPDAFRQRNGRRTTCTTLESILSYQSSTDCSSSFQSRTLSTTTGDTTGHTQSKHLQSLIDGVLEDIEDLLNQGADSSRGGFDPTLSPINFKQSTPKRLHRSASMSSIGSAHSRFQWPIKGDTTVQEPVQLRLLGAKLFSSGMDIQPQDSPCPSSKRRPTVDEANKNYNNDEKKQSNRVSQLDLTKKFDGGFRTDLVVGQACIPPLSKHAFQSLLHGPKSRPFVGNVQKRVAENSSFVFSSSSPSRMQPLIKKDSSPLPPTIRVQRPLSETSFSSATVESSPDVAVIQRAKVVQNRKSSASLMDLNGVLNQCNIRRARSPSCSSNDQNGQQQEAIIAMSNYGSPSTPLSFTSSSQPWSDSTMSRLWSSQKRNSFSTIYTDISPVSATDYKMNQQKHVTSPLSIVQNRACDEEEEFNSNQEAIEVLEWSRQCYPDSEYARQILSTFTPPKTVTEVIKFLEESREAFQPLHGKTPSLITICVVERQRDQMRIKRRSLRHPLESFTMMSNNILHESQVDDEEDKDDNDDDDCGSQSSGLDEAAIFIPQLLTRWPSLLRQRSESNPTFQYIVQSPSTESTSTNHN